jgi:osomolarity two-component system, response regulator SKN7
MVSIPRELNPIGPSGDASTALLPAPAMGADAMGKINPLAGMGLSDAAYAGVLANMVAGDAFGTGPDGNIILTSSGDKRAREGDDGREVKRSRFEEVV